MGNGGRILALLSLVSCWYDFQMYCLPIRYLESVLFEAAVDPDWAYFYRPQMAGCIKDCRLSYSTFFALDHTLVCILMCFGNSKCTLQRWLNCRKLYDQTSLSTFRNVLAEKRELVHSDSSSRHWSPNKNVLAVVWSGTSRHPGFPVPAPYWPTPVSPGWSRPQRGTVIKRTRTYCRSIWILVASTNIKDDAWRYREKFP